MIEPATSNAAAPGIRSSHRHTAAALVESVEAAVHESFQRTLEAKTISTTPHLVRVPHKAAAKPVSDPSIQLANMPALNGAVATSDAMSGQMPAPSAVPVATTSAPLSTLAEPAVGLPLPTISTANSIKPSQAGRPAATAVAAPSDNKNTGIAAPALGPLGIAPTHDTSAVMTPGKVTEVPHSTISSATTSPTGGFVPIHAIHSAGGQAVSLSSGKTAESPNKLAGPATEAPELKTITSTPNVLEIGIATQTHGWLRVRAQLGSAGDVSACVVAASAGAAEMLHKELPALTAYLATEHVAVSALVVNSAAEPAGAQGAATNAETGPNNAASQTATSGSSGGKGERGRTSPDEVVTVSVRGGRGHADHTLRADYSTRNMPAAVYARGGGGWLSVRV